MTILIVKIDGSEYDLDNYYSLDDVLEAVNAERLKDYEEYNYTDTPFEEWTVEQMLNGCDWSNSGIHEKYQGDNVYEYIDALKYLSRTNDNAEDLLEAAIECGVEIDCPKNILDTYLGHYKSDEDYARQYAASSSIDTTTWPYNCIDWEDAAAEILQGVSEHNHYYFN